MDVCTNVHSCDGQADRASADCPAGPAPRGERDASRPGPGPVLLVTPWYRPAVGGVAEVAGRLLRGLQKADVPTRLLVCQAGVRPRGISQDARDSQVWRVYVPWGLFRRLGPKSAAATFLRGAAVTFRLLSFIRSGGIRTVVLIYPLAHCWPFVLLRRLGLVSLVCSLHGGDLRNYARQPAAARWLFRKALLASQALTVCSEGLADELRTILPGRALPVELVENAVDLEQFVPAPAGYPRLCPDPTLVHVSNFAPVKRTLDIIEAFAAADVPPASRLVMVGAGEDLPAAMRRAGELGVSSRVEFVGAVADVRPYLWQADAFVLASQREGSPLALLEAMACGLAWISPPWGPAGRLPQGLCGLVVPPCCPQRLAEAMSELLNDPPRTRAMGRQARLTAERELSESIYIRRHIEILRQVQHA